MANGRHWLLRYAAWWLLPLSIVVALLLAEGLLRLNPKLLPEEAQIRRLWQLQTRPSSIADPYLGSVYPPHYRTTIESLDFKFLIESDEHGFRNPSPWPEQAQVVIVGDSFANGWGVARETSWIGLLDEALPDSRVITLGMPGTVPQQYFRYLERFGVGLKPKLVIFGIFVGNDIVEAAIFNRWLAAGSPGNYNEWRFFEGKVPRRRTGLVENSYLKIFLQTMRKQLGSKFSAKTITFPDGEELQLAPGNLQQALHRNDPLDPGFRMVVDATLASRKLAHDNGSAFLVVLFPPKEGIYLPVQGVPFPSLARPLRDVLQDEGVLCLDLTSRLQELAAHRLKLYFEIDGHLNELGQRAVAATLLGYLQRNAAILGLEGLRVGEVPAVE
jgi:hypothetical protein